MLRDFSVQKYLNYEDNGIPVGEELREQIEAMFPGGEESPEFQKALSDAHDRIAAVREEEAAARAAERQEEQDLRDELRALGADELSQEERDQLEALDAAHDGRATEDDRLDELEWLEGLEGDDALSPGEQARLDKLRGDEPTEEDE
jgi:hypothetical protein